MTFSIVTFVRLGLLATVTFFSLIVLGTAAHILSVTQTFLNSYWAFDAFAVAVSVMTLVTLPALIVFSLISKGAFPNYVVVELGWITVLWILWMSSAAYSANSLSILPSGCSYDITFFKSLTDRQTVNCGEFWALEAFSWLIWLILMPYTILLLVLSIIQHTRGNTVWTQRIHEVDFFAPRAGGVVQPGMVPQPQLYSPQPMVQQPLQQQYTAGTPPAGYATPPAPQQSPMNTGYAQPPANTGYSTPPAQQQTPMNTGYVQPPVNTGYTQAPVNTGYSQAPYVPAPANPGYAQGSPNPGYTQV